jgi:hypothetical protein
MRRRFLFSLIISPSLDVLKVLVLAYSDSFGGGKFVI